MNGATRYRQFQLPKTHHWGVYDRNTGRFLLGVIADDEIAASALAFLLNREFGKWVSSIPEAYRGTACIAPDPDRAVVPFIFRKADNKISVADDDVPRGRLERQEFRLDQYIRRAPDSERRLIARLVGK